MESSRGRRISKSEIFVQNRDEIVKNILTLDGYRRSHRSDETNFHGNLLRLGVCFVAYENEEENYFGPSRFIGYRSNNLERHQSEWRTGSQSNQAIERVLGTPFEENALLEKLYQQSCERSEISPSSKRRRFISVTVSNFDIVAGDIRELRLLGCIEATQREQLVMARIGQGGFRKSLEHYWKGCSVSGCREVLLLRASHIKPWRECENFERLDPFNGLLLTPNLDAAFDRGLISFDGRGRIMLSERLSAGDAALLGITADMGMKLNKKHLPYLAHHRNLVFKKRG